MNEQIRQMPTDKNYLKDRNLNDLVYGYLQSMSYINNDVVRFVYKKHINKNEMSSKLNISRPTLNKYLKCLREFGLLKESLSFDINGRVVEVIELPESKDKFMSITVDTLDKLINVSNNDVIKLYTFLVAMGEWKLKDDLQFDFTIQQLAKTIGYKKSKTSHDAVRDILQCLTYIGLIECSWNGLIGQKSMFYLNKWKYNVPNLEDINRKAYQFDKPQPKTTLEKIERGL